jgi:hypothetical protein
MLKQLQKVSKPTLVICRVDNCHPVRKWIRIGPGINESNDPFLVLGVKDLPRVPGLLGSEVVTWGETRSFVGSDVSPDLDGGGLGDGPHSASGIPEIEKKPRFNSRFNLS